MTSWAESNASASDPENAEPGSSARPRPPATPAKALAPGFAKQLQDEVEKLFEGGLDIETATLRQVRASIEQTLSLDSGALDEHKDFIGKLFQEKIQKVDNPTDFAKPSREATEPAPPAKQESETGKIWTYEVTETIE